MLDQSIFIEEPADVYHAKAAHFLSSHQLNDFIKCPLLYHMKRTGQIQDKDSAAYTVGRAAHVRILEGRKKYAEEFAIGGPINERTGKPYGSETKAFAEWAANIGKPVVTESQHEMIEQIGAAVERHDVASSLLACGIAERVVRTDYCGVPCQIRPDWLSSFPGQIADLVDLKTCDDLTYFESDARRFGYARQLAFYAAVLRVASGATSSGMLNVQIIAVEKREPFRCGVWRLSDDTIAAATRQNKAAIARLVECERTGVWPTLYEDTRLLEIT